MRGVLADRDARRAIRLGGGEIEDHPFFGCRSDDGREGVQPYRNNWWFENGRRIDEIDDCETGKRQTMGSRYFLAELNNLDELADRSFLVHDGSPCFPPLMSPPTFPRSGTANRESDPSLSNLLGSTHNPDQTSHMPLQL